MLSARLFIFAIFVSAGTLIVSRPTNSRKREGGGGQMGGALAHRVDSLLVLLLVDSYCSFLTLCLPPAFASEIALESQV